MLLFDTLSYANKLINAGFSKQQADVQAESMKEVIENNLATKENIEELKHDMKEIEANLRRDMKEIEANLRRDMKEMEANLRRDMKEIEASLKRDIKESEMRMTIRLGTLMAFAITVVATLVKIL